MDINSEETIQEPEISELQDNEKKIPAEIGLAYCNKFFFIERQLKDLPPDERMMNRQEKEVPVWDSFFKWIETINPLGGSKLEKALNYALNHKG